MQALTPLDAFGALIADRRDGERLSDYRKRVLDAARHMAHRDASNPAWRGHRAAELAAHLGTPVVLESGGADEELLKRAAPLTWDDVEAATGPVRWPEPSAAGPAPLYGRAGVKRGGVAGRDDLRPFIGKRLWAAPGVVETPTGRYVVSGRVETAWIDLPAGTTETVLISYNIDSDHPHRIEVVDEETLRLVADDHTHVWTVTDEVMTAAETDAHVHTVRPLKAEGKAYLTITRSVPVTGAHAFGNATKGDARRLGPAVAVPRGGVELDGGWSDAELAYAEGFDYEALGLGAPPAVPAVRAVTPVVCVVEGARLEADPDSPWAVAIDVDRGWAVARSRHGLGERLAVSYVDDASPESFLKAPALDGLIGLGEPLPATQAAVTEIYHDGAYLTVVARAEDAYTGGVPGQLLRASASGNTAEGVSDASGNARIRFPSNPEDAVTVTLVSAGHAVTVSASGRAFGAPIGYGGSYGQGSTTYGG